MAHPVPWRLPRIETFITPDVMVYDLSFVRVGDLPAPLDEPRVTPETIHHEVCAVKARILDMARPHLERLAQLKVLEGEYIHARMLAKAAGKVPGPDEGEAVASAPPGAEQQS